MKKAKKVKLLGLALTPTQAVLAGVGVVGAGAVIVTQSGKIKELAEKVANATGMPITKVIEKLEILREKGIDVLNTPIEIITRLVTEGKELVGDIVGKGKEIIDDIIEYPKGIFIDTSKKIQEYIGGTYEKVKEEISPMVSGAATGATVGGAGVAAATILSGVAVPVIPVVAGTALYGAGVFKGAEYLRTKIEKPASRAIAEVMMYPERIITKPANAIYETAKTVTSAITNAYVSSAQKTYEAAKSFFSSLKFW